MHFLRRIFLGLTYVDLLLQIFINVSNKAVYLPDTVTVSLYFAGKQNNIRHSTPQNWEKKTHKNRHAPHSAFLHTLLYRYLNIFARVAFHFRVFLNICLSTRCTQNCTWACRIYINCAQVFIFLIIFFRWRWGVLWDYFYITPPLHLL